MPCALLFVCLLPKVLSTVFMLITEVAPYTIVGWVLCNILAGGIYWILVPIIKVAQGE